MEDRTAVMQRVHALREAIHLHQYQYYVENRSSLSDAEYDTLYRELQAQSERHRSPLVWRVAADFLAGRRQPLDLLQQLA